jgi:hypothetical protein
MERMTRRRLLTCLLIATLLIVPIGGWVAWRALYVPEPARAFERLRRGMTGPEVDAAIGMPPGNYRTRSSGAIGSIVFRETVNGIGNAQIKEQWTWDDYIILVDYDATWKVAGFYLIETRDPSLLDRLRQFIGF